MPPEPAPQRRAVPPWTAGVLVAVVCLLVAVALNGRRADERTLRRANEAGGAGRLADARRLAGTLKEGTVAADAWSVRARVAELEQRLPSAATALRRELALRPNDWQAHRELAVVLQATGQAAAARRAYARSLALNPRQEPLFPFARPR